MDSHGYAEAHHTYECLLAAGAWRWVSLRAGDAFDRLRLFSAHQRDWLFGHFGFDLKAETESVPSRLPDPLAFPEGYFFVPEHLLLLEKDCLLVSSYSLDPAVLVRQVQEEPVTRNSAATVPPPAANAGKPAFSPAFSREEYIRRVEALRSHIHRGDCYEVNFCQEFYCEDCRINPLEVYCRLASISPNPFSAYYRLEDKYLLCASPERYLRLEGKTVWSQPIKGTAPRDLQDAGKDREIAEALALSSKERAENVMVVDLVRNDLSRVCKAGSVTVEELFGVYSFPQVHQLVSTVRGELEEGKTWIDAIEVSFPMGSMTGAPKKKVLELIERYESVRRGIFSGSLGYVDPAGNGDFNVVIRSILYNESRSYLSYLVGSGITWYADAAHEYEECLLKAAAIRKALETT